MSLVIITGSTGLVGSESVNFFCDKGFDVIGIDNNLRKFFFGKDGSTIWVKNKLLKLVLKFTTMIPLVLVHFNIVERGNLK